MSPLFTLLASEAPAEGGHSAGPELVHHVPEFVHSLGIDGIVTTQWIIMAVIVVLGFAAGRIVTKVPRSRLQSLFELLFDFLEGWLSGFIGGRHYARKYLPLLATFFMFILIANYTAMFPFAMPGPAHLFFTPTSVWGTTVGLALCTAIAVQVIGIREQGFKHYMAHFVQAEPKLLAVLMTPLSILEEVIHPFSLSLRLFGNIFAEDTLLYIVFFFLPLLMPIPIMGLMLLFGAIQAVVFTTLSSIYISASIHGHGH